MMKTKDNKTVKSVVARISTIDKLTRKMVRKQTVELMNLVKNVNGLTESRK